jgi:methylenetetrahydrofolate dehydrogenase (NADP+)/methenyltetrahydrofolate cyclohydrolase
MSKPTLLLAKPVAESIRAQVKQRVTAFAQKYGRAPKLSVVLVGEDPASVIYTTRKGEAAHAAGMQHETINFPGTATPAEVHAVIQRLNADPRVDGILIQRPSGGLPSSFKEEEVLYWVSPQKDVDAFHPENLGRLALGLPTFAPCTPAGVMEILNYYKISAAGKLACVIGRSSIVGKPMSMLLLQANATIFQAHSKTPDLRVVARQADIVVAAIGKPEFIDSSYLKDGAVVIDVGINRRPDGKVVGDANFEDCSKKASAITPVPGGVGPMTITILLQNTILAEEMRETVRKEIV